MASNYELRDCERSRREFPKTFSIPRGELRRDLQPGWLVKLVFGLPTPVDGYDAERMWVEVLRRDGDNYVGRLDNKPLFVKDLAPNDEIVFAPAHVAALDNHDERRLGALVGVGVDVLRAGAWPTWVTKVEPTNKHDSGWRIFSEREGNEGATLRALSTSTLFRAWAVTDSAIDVGWDGVFRWDEAACEYLRADALPARLREVAGGDLGRLHRPAPDPELSAVVTRRVLDEAPTTVQRLAKSKGHDDDSGWCVLVGDEPQAYVDNTKNSTVVPLARLLHLYPYLERVLGETRLAMWIWDDALADWKLVPGSTQKPKPKTKAKPKAKPKPKTRPALKAKQPKAKPKPKAKAKPKTRPALKAKAKAKRSVKRG